jgi:hypothetical protein
LTLEHLATAGAPLNVKSTLFSSTPSHGTPALQINVTPSAVPEVPLMFMNETLLIFIFDGTYTIKNHKRDEQKVDI